MSNALSPSRARFPLPLSPRPSSPLACHTSLHAGKGFIEIYSCLRLHVHTRAHTHTNIRACVYRTYVYTRTYAWSCILSEVESRVSSDRALTRSQPSQVYVHVKLYYQSTRRVYNLIRAVGRRRRESSRKSSPRCVAQSRPSEARSNGRRVCATSAWRRIKRQVILAYTPQSGIIER